MPVSGIEQTGVDTLADEDDKPVKYQIVGLAEADSWATDFHKWLNVPYDSGAAFVRDPDALRAALASVERKAREAHEVEAWAAPNGSYSLSLRLVKPDRPPPWRRVRMRSRRPVMILCG